MRQSAYQWAPPGGSESGPRGAIPSRRRSGSRTSKSGTRSCSSAPRPWKRTKRPSGSPAAGRTRCRSSGVAADLEVRDEDAGGADQDEAGDAEQADAAVDRVSAAEARERERPEDASGEAAEVPADGDVPDAEREDEVDHDQRQGAAEDRRALPLEDERGAEDPEDRAGGADSGDVRAEEQRAGRAREAGDEVQEQVAPAAERLLERGAEPPEGEHVQAEVEGTVVEEGCREQPPPVAARDLVRA